MREPVDGAAHLYHAGLPRPVTIELAQVVRCGHDARGAARGRGAERHLEPSRRGGVQAVQQPDVAGRVVCDALAVGTGVSRIGAVVVRVAV